MINTVILMGRLVRDPEIRTTTSGKSVCSFSLAVESEFQRSEEKTSEYFDFVAWGNTAEFVVKYFHKGRMLAIVGHIQTRTYTDKDGNKRKAVEVVADKAGFTGEKAESSAQEPSRIEGYEPAGKQRAPVANSADKSQGSMPEDDFRELPSDDDLPF